MKYLKYFEHASAYEVWKNGSDYVTPNISYVEENDTVFYEAEEEFAEDELLYYTDGTSIELVLNLTTLKIEKYLGYTGVDNANIDENGNVVVNVNGAIPGTLRGNKAMYWTSESVNDIPMNFEYILYDSTSNVTFSGEYNGMVTFDPDYSYAPNERIIIGNEELSVTSPILEIKSKISNKTHRILFQ